MRLLAGVLAAHSFTTTIVGDQSLSRRPMRRVMAPLGRMGARIDAVDGHAPLTIHGTALHAIATGNLLPAWVKVACVDINPATVTKLTDRGSVQTVGVVTDAEPFLRALVTELAI